MEKNKLNLIHFTVPFLATLIIFRTYLYFSPTTNLFISGYNIHHLFTGALVLVFTIPFLIFNLSFKTKTWAIILAGITSAMILDELTYLLFTDGSDLAYLSTTSLYGMLASSLIFILYCLIIAKKAKH